MKKMHRTLLLLLALVMALTFTACQPQEPDEPEVPTLPDALVTLRENVTLLAGNAASSLSRNSFSTSYMNLLNSGEGREYKEYANIKATLDQLVLEYGAYQIYMLTDLDDDLTALEVTAASNTAGSAPVGEWLELHKVDYAISQAQLGTPAGDMFARQWDDGILTWTAYAPIYDLSGSIIAVLAVEFPSDVIAEYPTWNRMSDQWNGVTEPPAPAEETDAE
ncbi:MAG: hypothetical protein E7223_06205 [Clostridiales bacterium]|nr:hypothetical protein [Clostridiales bacterium]